MNMASVLQKSKGVFQELKVAITKIDDGEEHNFVNYNFEEGKFTGYFSSVIDLVDRWMKHPSINRTIILTKVIN